MRNADSLLLSDSEKPIPGRDHGIALGGPQGALDQSQQLAVEGLEASSPSVQLVQVPDRKIIARYD
jgi:hypothetical protein